MGCATTSTKLVKVGRRPDDILHHVREQPSGNERDGATFSQLPRPSQCGARSQMARRDRHRTGCASAARAWASRRCLTLADDAQGRALWRQRAADIATRVRSPFDTPKVAGMRAVAHEMGAVRIEGLLSLGFGEGATRLLRSTPAGSPASFVNNRPVPLEAATRLLNNVVLRGLANEKSVKTARNRKDGARRRPRSSTWHRSSSCI